MVDPICQSFLDALAKQDGKPLTSLTPAEARVVLENLQKSVAVTMLPADIKKVTIPVGSQGTVDVYILRPQNSKDKLPVILWMHGGGWVLGSFNTHERLMREVVNETQAAVVFVEYTRAPEAQYPVIHEQGYAAAQWVEKHGAEYDLDASCMAIAGDSVGGLLATSIAMMAQQRKGPKFLFQALLYPVTDAQFQDASYGQFAKGYWLEKNAMYWFWDAYVPDKAQRKDPLVSPLQASLEQLKQLPPALIMTNECDVLRDEGEAYAHKLMQAGVPVVAVRYLGLIHDSLMLNVITQTSGVRAALHQLTRVLKQYLVK